MSQSSDLMGLGLPPLLAERIADAGTGPVNITATGTAASTGYALRAAQYFVIVSTSSGNYSVTLPTPGGDTGPLIGDNFVITNLSTTAVSLFAPSGVTMYFQGSVFTTTAVSISQYHNMECWVIGSVTYQAAAN
jgi:hypothetical protein